MIGQKYNAAWMFILSCAFLWACSSAESDGKKAAERLCDCHSEYAVNLAGAYTSYIESFDSYGFGTRVEARDKLAALIQQVEAGFERSLGKAEAYKDNLAGKYLTNRTKSTEFQYAYEAQIRAFRVVEADVASFQNRINGMILSIIPPKPDQDKLKQDLVGRKINDAPDGYRRSGWYWEIKSPGEVKNVEIRNEVKSGDDYIYDVRILLQDEFNQYEADVKITYVLRQHDEWTIDFLGTEDLQIVRTHKYDSCITARRTGWPGEYGVEFTNRCDVPLMIGGKALTEFTNEWKTFSVLVDANGVKQMGGLFFSVKDYNIHFIERP